TGTSRSSRSSTTRRRLRDPTTRTTCSGGSSSSSRSREAGERMSRYFVTYRKTEEAGQKPEWASFTTESPVALETHAIRERVEKRLGLFGERLTGAGEVQFLGSAPLVEFLVRRVGTAARGPALFGPACVGGERRAC